MEDISEIVNASEFTSILYTVVGVVILVLIIKYISYLREKISSMPK
jgi:hypothetical protein